MKTWMAVLMLGSVLSMQPAPADAFDGVTFSMQGQGFGHGKGHRGDARPMRDARPVQAPPPPPVEPRRGQLSDEERRQLRRDLDKANRELYRGKGF